MVALTIGVDAKWLDNLLSHHELPGVLRGRQGVERRISDEGLLAIELVRLATMDLGVPVARAVMIAAHAIASPPSEAHYAADSDLSIHFSIARIEQRLRDRMVGAVEAVPRLPRGRPRLP